MKLIRHLSCLLLAILFYFGSIVSALASSDDTSVAKLKTMSFEELMNIEVMSVSRSPEKLTEVASAIQVLTHDDIQRSATTVLPEILRLAPNLQIAASGSHDWSVTARGFNGTPIASSSLSNKLLVMIDGRTVYNPLFGGVYWDVQNVLKEDLERIEVVSGPGGTQWGANAVNGVINVISKSAKETQGVYVTASNGDYFRNYNAVRYGGAMGKNTFYRVSAQRYDMYSSLIQDGSARATDRYSMTLGSFRIDHIPSAANTFTLQGDSYIGTEDRFDSTRVNGQNILGRWIHKFSEKSAFTGQVYYDRTWRNIRGLNFTDIINTFDIDLQNTYKIARRHQLVYGAGYRILDDLTKGGSGTSNRDIFSPAQHTLTLFNVFVQDQIALIPNKLQLTIGSKLLHNTYSGFDVQPSGRIAWIPNEKYTVWGAVSRAVRTPTRLDRELANLQRAGSNPFVSEKVTAYEIGYRSRPVPNCSYSIAAYLNNYNDLRSLDTFRPSAYENSLNAQTWGIELSGNVNLFDWWRIRGGYTYLHKSFSTDEPLLTTNYERNEALDPNHQIILQSIADLPKNFQLDLAGRYVSDLQGSGLLTGVPAIPSYTELDTRIAWTYRIVTFSVMGRNLLAASHAESGTKRIPRNYQLKVDIRL